MRHDSAMESARNGCPRRSVDVPGTPLILLDCAEIHAGFFAQFTLNSEGGPEDFPHGKRLPDVLE